MAPPASIWRRVQARPMDESHAGKCSRRPQRGPRQWRLPLVNVAPTRRRRQSFFTPAEFCAGRRDERHDHSDGPAVRRRARRGRRGLHRRAPRRIVRAGAAAALAAAGIQAVAALSREIERQAVQWSRRQSSGLALLTRIARGGVRSQDGRGEVLSRDQELDHPRLLHSKIGIHGRSAVQGQRHSTGRIRLATMPREPPRPPRPPRPKSTRPRLTLLAYAPEQLLALNRAAGGDSRRPSPSPPRMDCGGFTFGGGVPAVASRRWHAPARGAARIPGVTAFSSSKRPAARSSRRGIQRRARRRRDGGDCLRGRAVSRRPGYATEAARALIHFAATTPACGPSARHTRPEANASTRVLAKCGFVHVGPVVDPADGPGLAVGTKRAPYWNSIERDSCERTGQAVFGFPGEWRRSRAVSASRRAKRHRARGVRRQFREGPPPKRSGCRPIPCTPICGASIASSMCRAARSAGARLRRISFSPQRGSTGRKRQDARHRVL